MTDGIIQEVFKKYYTGGFEVDIDDNTVNVIPANTLEDAFGELIEKIKQNWREINKTHDLCLCNADIEILRMLVGDNQE